MLKNKVAIITGGNRGIGAATAQVFAEEGAAVVITHSSDATREKALAVVDGLEGMAVKCDVTDARQVDALIEETIATYGHLDILVNNAGIMDNHTVENLDFDFVNRTLQVNINGPVLCTGKALPFLIQSKGVIVNTASIVGLSPSLVNDVYAASKHALVGLTRSWALNFGPKGVRVNAVAPGPTTTDLLATVAQETLDKMKALSPMGRLGEPVEMARAILFLASDMSSYVNGQTLVVDGGRFMH